MEYEEAMEDYLECKARYDELSEQKRKLEERAYANGTMTPRAQVILMEFEQTMRMAEKVLDAMSGMLRMRRN